METTVRPGTRCGNHKLGPTVGTFSILVEDDCPGATPVCKSVCYGKRGHLLHKVVRDLCEANSALVADRLRFRQVLRHDLHHGRYADFRIHPVGDFKTLEYIDDWRRLVQTFPRTRFWAYTRSWTLGQAWQDALFQLSLLDNFSLWLSCDRDTGTPPKWPGVRTAYLMADAQDHPPYRTDLVFRHDRRQVMKYARNGALVCPVENGVKTQTQLTCARCRLCIDLQRIPHKRELRPTTTWSESVVKISRGE